MAKNLKTIKFGENGEIYAVDAPVVTASGELTEAGEYLDFGTFEDGLTELECVVDGVEGTEGNYFYFVINGATSPFLANANMYKAVSNYIRFKKIGMGWLGYLGSPAQHLIRFEEGVMNMLSGAEKITSFAIKSYNANSKFAAGTKYSLEGR